MGPVTYEVQCRAGKLALTLQVLTNLRQDVCLLPLRDFPISAETLELLTPQPTPCGVTWFGLSCRDPQSTVMKQNGLQGRF